VEQAPENTRFPPVDLFIAYHLKFLSLLEKDQLTPASFAALSEDHTKLQEAAKNLSNQRHRDLKVRR
jgi:hypothetical protein